MRILITGAAGFIGAALSRYLLTRGDEVLGIDNLNNYYDVRLKQARLSRLTATPGFVSSRLRSKTARRSRMPSRNFALRASSILLRKPVSATRSKIPRPTCKAT
jgi:nucleoside-diphosphate-sugar epimerase